MLKIISIIICTTVYAGNRIEAAIATSDLTFNSHIAQIQAQRLPEERVSRNENLTKTLILVGLISGVGVIGWQLFRQGRLGRSTPLLSNTSSKKALIDRVSPKLRRQLLRLINDPKTANRLLMGIQKHHGDRDPDWLAEKVIYDLRRGR